jgi:hypothetical protein
MANKKTKRKKAGSRKAAKKNAAMRRTTRKASGPKPKNKPKRRKRLGRSAPGEIVSYGRRGLGAASGGQSGDIQGIPAAPDIDSESVEELLEEGQSFEAEVIDGVENAPEPDEGEIRTREVPEDDVPEEDQQPDEYRQKS